MECYPLDLTIISAEGLKNVNVFSRMDVFAEVRILGYPKNKQKTHVDKNGGTAPKWNHHMRFIIDEPSLNNPGVSLLIKLKSDRTFGSDKEIGEVNLPISELFNGGVDADTKDSGERVVEYQVRTSSGKPKGTIKFSYKFGEKFKQEVEAKKKNVGEPVTAYPAPQHAAGASMAYPPHYDQGYAMPPPSYQQPYGGYAPPPPGYGGYPPPSGYPPAGAPGYGYPPPPGYGYPPQPYQQVQPPKKEKNKMGGLGLGLGAGLLGGLLVGDMMSDVGEMAAYDAGYDDALGF
ncbi:protein SRC2 homolog [Coffea eugenioides]|uniref:protein SRC2 homolog n=1 Tax=Coffea eugenioides TaxID=49369 RepID=UPI000F610892|nr:protein SRC2 homolog [Coffea eugenioides]